MGRRRGVVRSEAVFSRPRAEPRRVARSEVVSSQPLAALVFKGVDKLRSTALFGRSLRSQFNKRRSAILLGRGRGHRARTTHSTLHAHTQHLYGDVTTGPPQSRRKVSQSGQPREGRRDVPGAGADPHKAGTRALRQALGGPGGGRCDGREAEGE